MKRLMISMMIVVFLTLMFSMGYTDVESKFKADALALKGDVPKVLVKPNQDRLKELNERIKEDYDEMENISWFKYKDGFSWIGMDYYIGDYKDAGINMLRVKLIRRGEDWIFFKKVIIMADEKRYVIDSFNSYDKHTDVESSTSLHECIDLPICSIVTIDKIQKDYRHLTLDDAIQIASASEIKVRYSGDYYQDYTLKKSQRNQLCDVLQYYLWVLTNIGETYYRGSK